MRFVNDSLHLSGDKSKKIQRRTQLREINVYFVKTSSPDGASELRDDRIIAVKALRNIDIGEKLFIGYNSEHSFP